ncbi:hypothetical protein KBD45_00585 [Candidatus Dojkabacteria bacterium]|nr:hypothetical protein [Candidatus Dojkabacteria bacterium]
MKNVGKNLSYDPLDFNPDGLSEGGKLKEYLVPMLGLLIFIGILMVFTIPSINDLFGTYDLRDTANNELDQKEIELKELQNLRNANKTNKDMLERLQLIIPTSQTEVVNFVNKVEQISNDTSVGFKDAVAGERLILDSAGKASTKTDDRNLRLLQIPINFTLNGTLDNLRSLLIKIYNNDDFIVMTEMQLNNRDTETDGAKVELELSKYQYNTPASNKDYQELLKSISYKEKPDQDVIEFIQRKTKISGQE